MADEILPLGCETPRTCFVPGDLFSLSSRPGPMMYLSADGEMVRMGPNSGDFVDRRRKVYAWRGDSSIESRPLPIPSMLSPPSRRDIGAILAPIVPVESVALALATGIELLRSFPDLLAVR